MTDPTAAQSILRANDRGGYTVPNGRVYPFQWNWDSAFVALGFDTFDRPRAWTEGDLEVLTALAAAAERELALRAAARTAEAGRGAFADANVLLHEQQLELELANQQLQEQQLELEAQAEALQGCTG